MGASYNQKDAEGFIRILGLPARSRAIIHAKQPEGVRPLRSTARKEAVQ
jgi:argininosuccinate synthase